MTGAPVYLAPARALRPRGHGAAADCPFCAGHDSWTPPETFAIRSGPGSHEWRLRIFPNRYPAATGANGRHEVSVPSPEHKTSLIELSEAEFETLLGAYRDRLKQIFAEGPAWKTVVVFHNQGEAGGASQDHVHGQILALPVVPPRLAAKFEATKDAGPAFPEATDRELRECAQALRRLLVALEAVLPGAAYNLVLQTAAPGAETDLTPQGFCWHWELLPRVSGIAGLELGAGVWLNELPAPESAAGLRRGF
ncbi:MAG TPA: hypothetical protein VNC50_16145 [Planctomycetia bacterium]|nr:hypothetical protein [Planctomycetia bacterium]